MKTMLYSSLAGAAVTDFTITVILCILLHQKQSVIKRYDTSFNEFETGLDYHPSQNPILDQEAHGLYYQCWCPDEVIITNSGEFVPS